ncbi:MAG TPA: urate oxidase [Acidimicrobiia bacterium]|nr:urate oxidase [Acidimicrobiia bacterium]
MPLLDSNWGKSEVRVSKLIRGDDRHDFLDLTVHIRLAGEVEAAHTEGDNAGVLPTDTMKNTVYVLAQDHLTPDLEAFGELLCDHFLTKSWISEANVTIEQVMWARAMPTGFVGGSSERRTAHVTRGARTKTSAGVHGLVVLKTAGSAFEGFPKDEWTTLPETDDRILATSMSVLWDYASVPADTTATWERVRQVLTDHFFDDWSASMQHQGYQMAEAVLAVVPEISEISLRLPNQHHLPFDLTRLGVEWHDTVFQPVSAPYGDISMKVTR